MEDRQLRQLASLTSLFRQVDVSVCCSRREVPSASRDHDPTGSADLALDVTRCVNCHGNHLLHEVPDGRNVYQGIGGSERHRAG